MNRTLVMVAALAALGVAAFLILDAKSAQAAAANVAPVGTPAKDDGLGISYNPESGWGFNFNF